MVRTRIAPSPTGVAHVGTAYISLFNYAFAQKHQGKFILRIEDTDRRRYVPGSEKVIYQSLQWLGLSYDEGPDVGGPFAPYIQSQRLAQYQQYAQELVNQGRAYCCFCSQKRLKKLRTKQQKEGKPPMYDGRCRKLKRAVVQKRIKEGQEYVIRLKIPPKGKTGWQDLVRGQIVFENKNIDDQILLKSDGYPTYHLAVVIDDHLMEISHVIRAEEWISSTPKHILLYQAFDWPLPEFAHMPLLRNPDRSKISKRKNPVSLVWYRKQGYLPEALVNFLSLLGWSHPEEKEVFSLEEFIQNFDFERVAKTGPIFDLKKLDWLNGLYIRKKSQKDLLRLIEEFVSPDYSHSFINRTIPLVQERITKLSDYPVLVDFLVKEPKADQALLIKKGGQDKDLIKKQLTITRRQLAKVESWPAKNLEKLIRKLAEENKWPVGQYFMAIRIALSGKTVTPPLFESMEILGKEKTLQRLQKVIGKLA